jgi:hypothetical protein
MAAVTGPDNRYSVINADCPDALARLKPVFGRPWSFTAPADVFRTSAADVAGKTVRSSLC